MLSADISMELPLDQHTGQNEDLLSVGALYARDTHALCNDVAAVIFPTSITMPTDAIISAVTSKLVQLVTDIEHRLQGQGNDRAQQPSTWPLLAQSGFLREADLVDFILARVAEDRLEVRLNTTMASVPAQLLDHADGNVAEAAQILMAADSLHRRSRGNSYLALPAELLHKLCWRVVAALEVFHGSRSPEIIAAAREIIAGYDEGQRTAAAARKIVHFVEQSYQDTLLTPKMAGLHLYVAALSAALNIEHDHALRLIDAGSSAPYAVMLAALAVPKEQAIALIVLLRGEALTPREAGIFDHGYTALNQQTALTAISTWSTARAQFLAFGKP
jgi:hypothetical protein